MGKLIEQAFANTARVIFGSSLSGTLDDYGPWLSSSLRPVGRHPSAVSNQMVYDPPLAFYAPAAKRAVSREEAAMLGTRSLAEGDALSLTLENAASKLNIIRYHTSDAQLGECMGNEECNLCINTSHSYRAYSITNCKFCAYCFWPRDSEHVFGSDTLLASRFCIKCYNSNNLTRCLELNNSADCSDCLFGNNLESCADCLFCTNAKSLHYAVFNKEVGREAYLKLKKKLVGEMVMRLEKGKALPWSIFTIGQPV